MWTYNGVDSFEIPKGCFGFVYKITNNVSGKQYIGKKQFYSTRTKQLKGKKKRVTVESDWKDYFGSNGELIEDVVKLGKESFSREILKHCTTKGEASYYEAKYQFEFDVLKNPDKFYNSWIMCRIHRKHLPKTSQEVLDKEV